MVVAVVEIADQVVLDLVAVTSAVTGTSGEEVVEEDTAVVMVVVVVVDMVAATVEVQLVPGTRY
jgi:RecA/RadA recombinase